MKPSKTSTPESTNGKKKKVKAPKTNRQAIDRANGERNALRREQRAARHAIKNRAKGITSHKRRGPSYKRRQERRNTSFASAVAGDVVVACAQ